MKMRRMKVIKKIVHDACRGRVEGQVRAIWCSVFAAGVEKRPKVRGENDDDLTREASLSGRNATGIDPEEVLIWFGNVPVDSERVAIAILFTGILFLLTIVLHSWRQDLKKRRRQRRLRNAERDLPPSYNQVVDRKSPPEYKESLMQVWRGLFLKARL